MSKDNSTSIRGIHVSPGIYQKETVLTYATKNLGITTLGLVGETLKGPAFQTMPITNWREFQDTFGGTSTEKFQESQFPKYELPYIAKSYLSESNQLQVCRVLGLSGYEAGPAWVITANIVDTKNTDINGKRMPIVVLRSRGHYEKYHKVKSTTGNCDCPQQYYDKLFYEVGEWDVNSNTCTAATGYNLSALKIAPYKPLNSTGNECEGYNYGNDPGTQNVTPLDLGKFTLYGVTGATTTATTFLETNAHFKYAVSLNPSDKDYILKVLGTNPNDGDAPIYVESLYDVALRQNIEEGRIKTINVSGDTGLEGYQVFKSSEFAQLEPVYGIIDTQEEDLRRKDIGKRFLADSAAKADSIHCHYYNAKTSEFTFHNYKNKEHTGDTETATTLGQYGESAEIVTVGQIYTVKQYTDPSGKRHYYYAAPTSGTVTSEVTGDSGTTKDISINIVRDKLIQDVYAVAAVKNNADGRYYRLSGTTSVDVEPVTGDSGTTKDISNNIVSGTTSVDVEPVTCDMNNYKDAYRFASTPWIVSNVKGDAQKLELNKLFRFHTISDGTSANGEVKVSIANIRPDEGLFDVYVRQWNDIDASPIILERFTKCTLVKNSSNYIAYKIGSYDGVYESKSKYITVEVNENLAAQTSVPAGFLGYPLSQYTGLQFSGANHTGLIQPLIKYNCNYTDDIKHRKQYFGLSDIVGVDIDTFTYKGAAAYGEFPEYLTQGFHLDARLDLNGYPATGKPTITVDGETGYTFDCVSKNARTELLTETAVIDTEANMQGSIYEYLDLRKFTVYFYGGFDGWDEYRKYRSNTDDFKMSKYKGSYSTLNGEGATFNVIQNGDTLGLNQPGITSDWYAYLAGARQFANPEQVDINVFATPGLDLINNKLLCEEIIEMIEEERADSIYVATMPDKPFGYTDFESDMYTADDAVYELEDTEIDSNYTCTYFPWVKYEDVDNSEYIYLPPTKDVVRNMAITDNTTAPWFAPAGLSRGVVDCVRAKKITKIEDEDILYDGRINPIKTFARDGVKIWGQKNLQKAENQLNRIHVRRLLLRMRKLIAIACLNLIFDPNDTTTKNKFLSLVTPIMDNIKANRGISDYKIEVNDSVEMRERRELGASIYFKPYNSLEYISLNFVVSGEGVSFDNI